MKPPFVLYPKVVVAGVFIGYLYCKWMLITDITNTMLAAFTVAWLISEFMAYYTTNQVKDEYRAFKSTAAITTVLIEGAKTPDILPEHRYRQAKELEATMTAKYDLQVQSYFS